MTKGNCLYKKMSAVGKVLSEDPETKDRYANATDGGRDWFCYSAWLVENRSRWHDGETARCRDSIASRLTSTDIAYVLQYETDADVVAYLKARLIDAVNNETTPIPVGDGKILLRRCQPKRRVGLAARLISATFSIQG